MPNKILDLYRVFRNAENLFHSNIKNSKVQQHPLGASFQRRDRTDDSISS